MSDISSISVKLVENLKKDNQLLDVALNFSKFDENHEKIDYVSELLKSFNYLPSFTKMRIEKNTEQSDNYRRDGDQCKHKKQYMTAIDFYNKSIAFAEPDSEGLSKTLANRSSVFSILELHKECLRDIELVKELQKSSEKFVKDLKNRASESEQVLEKLNKDKNLQTSTELRDKLFKLSYESNPTIPFIIRHLELQNYDSDSYGRSIITNRELNVGDVIAIEKPFAAILLPENQYERCANCLKENNYSLIPCPSCTSVMFCSEKCLKIGQEKFHKYECSIIDYLFTVFQRIHLIAIRVVIQAITFFKDIDRLIEFDKSSENRKKYNAFTINYKEIKYDDDNDVNIDDNISESVMSPEFYHSIHTLCTNTNKRTTDDLFHRAIPAAMISQLLIEQSDLKEFIKTNEHKIFIKNLIYRHLQIAPTNFHSLDALSELDIKANSQCDPQYGSGAYPFCSLINHSCAPNICRISDGSTIYVFVLRPIPEGEQLFDNYGFHHCLLNKIERQKQLKLQYCFECNCIACKKNYPLFHELSAATIPHIVSLGDITKMASFDKKFVNEHIEKYFQFLTKFSNHFYPCSQISDVEEAMKMCLKILSGNAPLKLTNIKNE